MTQDLTGLVVDTVLGLSPGDVSPAARQTAKFAILDLLACAVAGIEDDCSRITASWVTELGGRPEATVAGTTAKAPAALAALANATAGHALDFDDVSLTMIHPSTTVVPALLAVAESGKYTGDELLTAYAAGFEVQARICRALNPEHYGRGWHTTQTVGVLATAAAVAKLIGLDEEQTRYALGIAASSASGLRKNFGTMVKPLHAGQAAMHGVQAVQLAQRGFTADRQIMQGRNGYLEVFSTPQAHEALLAAFAPGVPLELETSGIGIKRFACCGAIHTALDAMELLMADGDVTPATVTRLECRVNPMTPNILVHHDAKDGLEGKFSMEYSLAVYLLEQKAGLAQYAAPAPLDPELVRLMRLTEVVVDDSLPVNLAFFPTIVTAELAGGTRRTQRVDSQHGYPASPLSLAELTGKVTDCCAPHMAGSRVEELINAVMTLETSANAGHLGTFLATGATGGAA
jgi:2-methylcitrate dehydratase PrpD